MSLNAEVGKDLGILLKHHFSDNEYAKETHIPAGHYLVSHKHKFDHLSILARGTVILQHHGFQEELTGPACINIKAGVHHQVIAVTDAVWFCIHATQEKDIDKVDGELIE